MHARLKQRLYNRLEQLARDNEGRLMAYLQRASTGAERQAKLKEQRTMDGFKRVPVWLHERDIAALRAQYPGPRGGIDWGAVLRRALHRDLKAPECRQTRKVGEET
jgi:erythromycin esterase-like protein